MSWLKMFNFVPCVILLFIIFDVVQSRFVYRPDIQREIKQDKVIATWQEAKEHCESLGAILASPIDAAHLNYMQSYIEVNDHTSAYFTGYKAVIHDSDLNYISVEGIFLDELPEVVINMIEKIDPEDGDCLSMDRREIRAVPCWDRLPYICYTKVTNVTSHDTTGVTSNVSTAVNTEVRAVVLPQLSSGDPIDVLTEVVPNVTVETSSSIVFDVITEETTSIPVEVATEVILEVPIQLYSSELVDESTEVTGYVSVEASSIVPEDMATEVTPDVLIEVSSHEPMEVTTTPVPNVPIGLSSSELVDVSVEVTTDISMETSSIVPVERTSDESIKVSSSEQVEVTTELVDITTDLNNLISEEASSTLPDVPVETTEVTIDERMSNADEEEHPSSVTGYSYYDTGSLYKLHDAPLPWANANATCAREGGYLAVINDDAEAGILAELGDIYPHVVWIGLKKEHGDWHSVQNDNLEVIFNKWSIIRANYECGVIMSTGVLDDRDCDYPLPFICEKNVVPIDAEVY